MVQWSSSITDRFVAPGLVAFRKAEIPDLSAQYPEAMHWTANYFLNSVLTASFKDGIQQLVLALLRRAENAFRHYHEARQATAAYLAGLYPGNQPLRLYFRALNEWEQHLLHSQIALDLFSRIPGASPAFVKADGSPEERLYTIGNCIKHAGERLASGGTNITPVWLTNDGLASFQVSVTFGELSEVLNSLAAVADKLQNPSQAIATDQKEAPAL